MADAQVAAWLRHAGLSRFGPRFAAALVSAPIFLQLSPTDLDALGVDGPADRKRLADLIADLRRGAANPPRRDSPPRAATVVGLGLRRPSLRPSDAPPEPAAPRDSDAEHRPLNRRLSRANSLSASIRSAANPTAPVHPPAAPRMARVTVCVRKRPLSRKELTAADKDVITVHPDGTALCVHELKEKVDLTKYVETHAFAFDRVFPERAGNPAVYEGTARPLVDTLFAGGRGTCFAYGQTGAGKTFTMAGDTPENPGLYTLAVRDVFDRIRRIESELWRKAEAEGDDDFEPPEPAQVWISFYEIYASKLQDLLNRSAKLECREDSNNEVQIVGLTERLCEVEEDVLAYIEEGSAARSTGVTGANDDSSRSHAVFQIELRHPPIVTAEADPSTTLRESLLRNTRSRTAAAVNVTKRGAEIGRLCFIDLAGSERGSDTASSTRQTRMEGAEINKSLLALKECIRAMDQKKDHTPFRGSKLTQVLKASFMGKNCSTVMIANISPASSNVEHTLNTLRYSDRVKEIKKERNSAHGNDLVSKSFGGRRATFSHGIGLRAGRSALTATPLRATQRQASSDSERADEIDKFAEQSATERKTSRSQFLARQSDRPPEKEEAHSVLLRTSSRPSGRRAVLRQKSKDAERRTSQDFSELLQGEEKVPKKSRESRITRRRTSRAPSMIPSRPSVGGSALMMPEWIATKKAGEQNLRRGNSGLVQLPDNHVRSFPIDGEHRSVLNGSGKGVQKAARPVESSKTAYGASTALAAAVETSFQTAGYSDDERKTLVSSPESIDSMPAGGERDAHANRPPRKQVSKSANAAESAMKYYMTNKKDELPEEDLLFAGTDNLVDAATAEAQERLCAVSVKAEEQGSERTRESPRVRPRSVPASERLVRRPVTTEAGTSPPTSEDSSPNRSFTTDTTNASLRNRSDALRKVIRFHHVQIEELMRLTESDVTLVNAAEKGDMDTDEYALKLKLNLTQKLDIITTLRSKLELLE